MDFPLYRKYANGASFFEVLSDSEFRELKVVGGYYELHHIKATILPERNYISDLINNSEGYYVEATQNEYRQKLAWCEQQLQPMGMRQDKESS